MELSAIGLHARTLLKKLSLQNLLRRRNSCK